jgi:lysophospholipase L1-like esterase
MLFLLIGIFILIYVGFMGIRIIRAYYANATVMPFSRNLKGASKHILILGDSTMYGFGIKDQRNTIGGLFAEKYPDATIETIAENGAKVKDLRQLFSQSEYKKYDLIVIGIGGNDIAQLSNYAELLSELTNFLKAVSKVSQHIVLCHSVNIGNIGFFIFPLNYFFDYRSRQLSHLFAEVAAKFSNVQYINFYRPMHNDYYDKTTRKKFIAEDAFHPSDYANQYFFNIMWKEMQ